jgi:riboflavin kinase/FMN adenylyltransferase
MIVFDNAPALMGALRGVRGDIGRTCVTVGNFDGVHIGHAALLAAALGRATRNRCPFLCVTFEPHPLEVLAPDMAPPRLTDTRTRMELLRAAGVEATLLLSFTRELAALSPEDFVRMLVRDLSMGHLLIGYDFSLGRGRAGNAAVLRALGERFGFACERFGPVLAGAQPVSSTRVRGHIRAGEMDEAAALLGRPYSLRGAVIRGCMRGRKLGFATANLSLPAVQLPPEGVYAAWARTGIERFPAVTSVGRNPTFGGPDLTIETHLLDFSRDLYGADLEIAFIRRLRGQTRFDGPQALIRQIERDIARTRDILSTHV